MERRLSAIFAADVAGYSRLMGQDEAGTHAELKRHWRELLEPAIAAHRGRIVNTAGDGLLGEFASVIDAVECAVAIQTAMPARNAGVAPDRQIVFRIGINLGDVIVDADGIYGDGVNVAARLQQLAAPGGIAVTSVVRENATLRSLVEFVDAGPFAVRNIDRPIHVWLWHPAGELPSRPAVADARPADAGDAGFRAAGRPTIAIMPFGNMSGDPQQDYFSDGLTEDIIAQLSRFPDLAVVAPAASFAGRDRNLSRIEFAETLGVDFLLEGRVRRVGKRVRITTQLIDARSSVHVWDERYDRDLDDIFAVHDEIAMMVAATLGVRLREAGLERSLEKRTHNLSAYDCVLRARRYLVILSEEEHARARDWLEEATRLDPSYADAFAVLAYVYVSEFSHSHNPRPDPLERALRAAQRGVELDPRNARAHATLAIAHFFRKELAAFVASAERALILNPSDPEMVGRLGAFFTYFGEYERGVELVRRSIRLNPLYPGWYHYVFARHHVSAGAYELALAEVAKTELPNFRWTLLFEASLPALLGRVDEARAKAAMLRRQEPALDVRALLEQWNSTADFARPVLEGLALAERA